jgi:RNA-directed DNA polymerase
VSTEVFNSLDDYMWKLTYKWAKYSHPNKPRPWVIRRYFGQFNPDRQDTWVFGDRDSGAHLPKFCWTKIVRHCMVPGTASPDDPDLARYWAQRRGRSKPPLGNATLRLLKAQDGRCPVCGDHLLHVDREPQSPHEWEQWLIGTRKAMARQSLVTRGSPGMPTVIRLVHDTCQRQKTGADRQPEISS